MPSADFCLLTFRVTPERAIGFHLVCSLSAMTSEGRDTYIPEPDWLLSRSHGKQISPDKNMNCHCATASFTVAVRSLGFAVLCQLAFSLRLI